MITFRFRGKKYTRSLGVKFKADALNLQRQIDYRISLGTFDPSTLLQRDDPDKGDTRLYAFLDAFLETTQKRNISAHSLDAYRYAVKLFKQLQNDVPLSFLETEKFVDWLEEYLIPHLDENYAPASVAHHLTYFRAIFNYALKRRYIKRNPFEKMVPKSARLTPFFYRKEELAQILAYFNDPHRPLWQQVYFPLLINTGLRKTEALNLKWGENIFLEEMLLKFPGKGQNERIVPLNNAALAALRNLPRKLGENRAFYMISSHAVDSAWRTAKRRLGITRKIHDFRKNYASWFMMSVGDVYRLMNIMGWSEFSHAKPYLALSKQFILETRTSVEF